MENLGFSKSRHFEDQGFEDFFCVYFKIISNHIESYQIILNHIKF